MTQPLAFGAETAFELLDLICPEDLDRLCRVDGLIR